MGVGAFCQNVLSARHYDAFTLMTWRLRVIIHHVPHVKGPIERILNT